MSYTKLRIFNLALRHLGVTASLQSVDGNDPKAATLRDYYDGARGQTLKDFDWTFASVCRPLALTESGASENPKYLYEYDYPSDCICPREIVSSIPKKIINFKPALSYKTGKLVINTDEPNAVLKYTKRIDNESIFPDDFVDALTWCLAFKSCDSLGLGAKRENAVKIYVSMLNKAIVSNSNEGVEQEEEHVDWLDVRN